MSERLDINGEIYDRRTIYLLDPQDRPTGRPIVFTYNRAENVWESQQANGAARRSAGARWHRRLLRVRGRDLQSGLIEYETFVMNGNAQITHWVDLLPARDFSAIDNESFRR